jgi:8-oxo-dGTP pyrophosphatase MutT (NUDIX family)
MGQKWEIISSEEVFECKWFSVERQTCKLPNGNVINDYFIVKNNDIVTVIPFTKDYEVVVLKEYKHGYQDEIFTFPSGILESGEKPIDGASRELKEETGYVGKLKFLNKTFPNPTSSNFSKHCFIAENIKKVSEKKLDATEFIQENLYSIDEVLKMIDEGKIVSDLSICSFYTALREIGKLQINK